MASSTSIQDLRDILASWKGQKASPKVAEQLSELAARLNAYDQDNIPASFRARSQAKRQMEEYPELPAGLTKLPSWLQRGTQPPEMTESNWAPAHESAKEGFLHGANIRRGISSMLASPLMVTDAAEMALDAVRGTKSPNRFLAASNTISELLGETPEPASRFPSGYDKAELAGSLLNPSNLLGLGEIGTGAKTVKGLLKSPKNFAGGGLARLATRLSAEAGPARRGIPSIVKEGGGNWLSGSVEDVLQDLKTHPAAYRGKQSIAQKAINNWVDKPLARYVKNDMATQQDPVRQIAEAWPAKQKALLAAQQSKIDKLMAKRAVSPKNVQEYIDKDIEALTESMQNIQERNPLHFTPNANLVDRSSALARSHRQAGRKDAVGISPAAQQWETLSDSLVRPQQAGDLSAIERGATFGGGVDVAKDTPVNELLAISPGGSRLGFDHLIDELSNAVDPESGLPPSLQFPVDRLDKVTMPQAVERVAAINQWRAEQMALANKSKANNAATVLHKEYPHSDTTPNPKGLRWTELGLPKGDFPLSKSVGVDETSPGNFKSYALDAKDEHKRYSPPFGSYDEAMADAKAKNAKALLQDALKFEGDVMGHCIGGYCDDVASGKSQIYSLRDAKGQPHVTIEVVPEAKAEPDNTDYIWRYHMTPERQAEIDKLFSLEDEGNTAWHDAIRSSPEAEEYYARPLERRIAQIKGKQNQAPSQEYLPFVQDFVKSGKWSDVGDLENTGLGRLEQNIFGGSGLGDYATQEEIDAWRKNNPNFAKGGSVGELRGIIAQLRAKHAR